MSEPPEKKDAPPAGKTSEASPSETTAAAPSETTGLDKTIQELIGQKLRSEYNAIADKPAYLGDPMLPPEMEDQITKLGTTIRAHETGIEAVEEALKNIGSADDDETSQDPSKEPSKP